MADLTIHNFAQDLQKRLRARAAKHGRSIEAEAREILRQAVKGEVPEAEGPGTCKEIYEGIRAIVEPHGGYELDIPPRRPRHEPPSCA